MLATELQQSNHQLTFDWGHHVLLTSNSPFDLAQNEQFVVIVDGEIRPYGSQSKPGSSAALLLTLLGEYPNDFYGKLAGFFNAIIYDVTHNKIMLINDHIGSRALYYQLTNGDLIISTSLDLFESSTLLLNQQAIFNYFSYHCIAAPTTIYQNIFKLEAGQCVSIDSTGELTDELIYLPSYNYSQESNGTLYKTCRDKIAQAVAGQVNGHCGAFLSGGLDSSTVAGMLANNITPAKTFSIGFESKQYDESEYAELTARHFSTQHYSHVMQPDELVENFKQVASYFDQPFGNSSAMAAYRCAVFAKEHGVTKLLAGDGGDEIFAGNERYARQAVFEPFNRAPSVAKKLLEGMFCHTPLAKMPLGRKAASYINQAKMPLPERLDSHSFLNCFPHEEIFTPEFLSQVNPEQPTQQKRKRYHNANSGSQIESMLFLDWKFTLADNDLVKVSKMCELAGVEVSYPLLEKELVDFSCQIKDTEKLKGNYLRHFFKHAMQGFLPEETLSKEKHGFGLPFGLWMTQSPELMKMAQSALEAMKKRNIFNTEFIELALLKHQSEHSGYYGELIWIVVILELWLESRGL